MSRPMIEVIVSFQIEQEVVRLAMELSRSHGLMNVPKSVEEVGIRISVSQFQLL